jgi:hypothetical protein
MAQIKDKVTKQQTFFSCTSKDGKIRSVQWKFIDAAEDN